MSLLKKIQHIILPLLSMAIVGCDIQIRNAKTETVVVYGNCSMCKKKIDAAGSIKGVAEVEWNEDSKQARITYDSQKSNINEILKHIASSGYDSDSFRATDDAYDKLHKCCQYERAAPLHKK